MCASASSGSVATPRSLAVDAEDALVYRSRRYLRALEQLERFARDRYATVLIEGESGTGKTQAARHVHRHSPRSRRVFHSVVLSTLDDALASSELFGHVTGAFTDARYNRPGHFATANGGTLFLDEIGKTTRAVQQKLLHAVEYGEIRPVGTDRDVAVDVRIVAATNVSLEELVRRELFLPDLFARISAFRVRLPALRERRADIPVLVSHYVKKRFASAGHSAEPVLTDELMEALIRAPWSNNLRELDATVHRLLVEAEGEPVIGLESCRDGLSFLRGGGEGMTEESLERALLETAGNVAAAARVLGVDRGSVYRFRRRRGG
jgi:two-component system, NtrC family, response regulator